jgi:hypothetical protein
MTAVTLRRRLCKALPVLACLSMLVNASAVRGDRWYEEPAAPAAPAAPVPDAAPAPDAAPVPDPAPVQDPAAPVPVPAATPQPTTVPLKQQTGPAAVPMPTGPTDVELSDVVDAPDAPKKVWETVKTDDPSGYEFEVSGDSVTTTGGIPRGLQEARLAVGWAITGKDGKSEDEWQAEVANLGLNAPIDGAPVTHTSYRSEIPDTDPDTVMESVYQDPTAFFAASGLQVRGLKLPLEPGKPARAMLFEDGTNGPGPVEIVVDPITRQVTVTTLDGHPLRAKQQFRFERTATGTRVVQESDFQMAYTPHLKAGPIDVNTGYPVMVPTQHDIWRKAHGYLYEKNKGRTRQVEDPGAPVR